MMIKKEKSEDQYEKQFKTLIKNIIKEEKYFKEDQIKKLAEDILKQIEPLIAKHVKNHFREIGNFIIQNNIEK